MNAKVTRTVTGPCTVCGVVFTAPVVYRGKLRRRCDIHWFHAPRKKRIPKITNKVRTGFLAPCTGIAIARYCLCCRGAFIAHAEAALYCGIPCFLQDRKGKPIPEAQRRLLLTHRRVRIATENRP